MVSVQLPCAAAKWCVGPHSYEEAWEERMDAYDDLLEAVRELGYPEELGAALAAGLGGEWSMRRMAGYLRGARPRTMEEIADEMVAILDQRQAIVERKMAERSQDALNAFYNRE